MLFVTAAVSGLAGTFALPLGIAAWFRCEWRDSCASCRNCGWILIAFVLYSAVQFLSVGLFGRRLGRAGPVDRVALASWCSLFAGTTAILWYLTEARM